MTLSVPDKLHVNLYFEMFGINTDRCDKNVALKIGGGGVQPCLSHSAAMTQGSVHRDFTEEGVGHTFMLRLLVG